MCHSYIRVRTRTYEGYVEKNCTGAFLVDMAALRYILVFSILKHEFEHKIFIFHIYIYRNDEYVTTYPTVPGHYKDDRN
jgi:hypothetical protein